MSPGARAHREHEVLFLEHYDRLWVLARRLAGADRSHAEDLLQDCYLQFVDGAPDLASIDDPGIYLAAIIRNLHVSRMRRHANQPRLHVSLEEFDSAALALRATPADQQLAASVALARVCAHLGRRKDSSRPASALILRFLHDFEPADIARLTGARAATVHDWLRQARQEARAAAEAWQHDTPVAPDGDADHRLRALREAIFDTCRTPCPEAGDWAAAYRASAPPLDTVMLAHLVSCQACLTRASLRAGLGVRASSGGDAPPPATGRGESGPPPAREIARRGSQRGRETRQHRPRQLFVSVNGLAVGEVSVGATTTHGRWVVRQDEPMAFVELHSEQGVRMAMLHVVPMALGHVEQHLTVALSGERVLTLSVEFSTAQPAVMVHYEDPGLDAGSEFAGAWRHTEAPVAHPEPGARWRWIAHLAAWLGGSRARYAGALMTAAVVVGLTAAWMLRSPDALPDAAVLLGRAIAVEPPAGVAGAVTLETLDLTVRALDDRESATTYRVERWTDRESSRNAMRVLDAGDRVVAGRWGDGAAREASARLDALAVVWQAGLSVVAIRDRFVAGRECETTADAAAYHITCGSPTVSRWLDGVYPSLLAQVSAPASTLTVRQATVTLARPALEVTRLTLVARIDAADYEVVVSGRTSRQLPVGAVPAGVFAPVAAVPAPAVPDAGRSAATPVASASFEMQLVELVDRLAGQEQVSVQRTNTTLEVTGLVTHDDTKRDLLSAIRELDATRVVAFDVRTFAEAPTATVRPGGREAARVEAYTLPAGPPPFEAFLRARHPDLDASRTARELSPLVLAAAADVRRQTRTLRSLIRRYPDAVVPGLDRDGRAAWVALVTRRASAAQTALARVAALLRPYSDLDESPLAAPVDDPAAASESDRRAPRDVAAVSHALDHESVLLHDSVSLLFLSSPDERLPWADLLRDVPVHLGRTSALVGQLLRAVPPDSASPTR